MLDRASGGQAGDLRLLVDDHGRPVAGSAAALTLWSGWRGEPGRVAVSFDDSRDSRGFNVLASPTALAGGHLTDQPAPRENRFPDFQ